MTAAPHLSVMLRELVEGLCPRDGGIYVDGTFGAGGHAKALLDAARTRVYGIDRDPEAIERGRAMAAAYGGRLVMLHGRYGDMVRLLHHEGVRAVDGVALDVGVSSMQLDDGERGFSFMRDGPLDMRMERSGPDAAEAVNTLSESALTRIIRTLGEERHAGRVARAIVRTRSERPFTRTSELAETVRAVVRKTPHGPDPATRTFQALRIHVNDELGEIERGLRGAEVLLRPGGRLAVISFHSLEDRIVKRFLKDRCGRAERPSRHMPETGAEPPPSFRLVNRKPSTPGAAEIEANPRARSARLRIAERTDAPPRAGGTP